MIKQDKWLQLRQQMLDLGISEDQLTEKFIIGSGSGGQKLQKTASCVHLKHQPTGIIIKCQQDRSQENNRYYARVRLCEKIRELQEQTKSRRQQLEEKIRRQKRRRSRRAKQKILEDKHHRSDIKTTRKKPDNNNS